MRILRYTYPNYENVSSIAALRPQVFPSIEAELSRLHDAWLATAARERAPRQIAFERTEDEGNVYLQAELPGVAREAIEIVLEGRALKIAAQRKTTRSTEPAEVQFRREWTVPESFDLDAMTAAHVDGVLTLTLPKKVEPKDVPRAPRKVAIG